MLQTRADSLTEATLQTSAPATLKRSNKPCIKNERVLKMAWSGVSDILDDFVYSELFGDLSLM